MRADVVPLFFLNKNYHRDTESKEIHGELNYDDAYLCYRLKCRIFAVF